MRPQEFMLLAAAALLSAIVATLAATAPLLIQIEEAWNIVVVIESIRLTRIVFLVALAHAFVLGLPLYFLLRSKGRFGIASSALAGFLIGAAPLAVLALVSMVGMQHASTGGKPTVVNGVPTLAGWIEYGGSVGIFGLFGLAGGLTFWAVIRLSSQKAEKPNGSPTQPSKLSIGSWATVSLAALLTCTVLVLPRGVRDNSCHNLFRDGRTSIGPQIDANIKLDAEDWPILSQLFSDFSVRHSLSLRRDEKIQNGAIMWRSLKVCNEAGVNIRALDQPWLDSHSKFPFAGRGISFSIFEVTPGSGWNSLAPDLLDEIERRWPQRLVFRGPDGKIISVEAALEGRR
jgi:hypothetical protein